MKGSPIYGASLPYQMPKVRPRASKPRLPAKTLNLLNAYRDHLVADVSYHAYGGHDKEFKAAVRKARLELVKHLLKP